MRRFWFLAPILLAATAQAQPSLSAKASKTRLTVGERFQVEVRATGPRGTTWTFPPEAGDEKVDLRVSSGLASTNATSGHDGRRYQAAVFAADEVSVPSVTVRYRLPDGSEGELQTDPIPLHIVSVLPQDPQERKLADIRGPLGLSVGRAFYLALATATILTLVLSGTALWALWRRRRRSAPPPAVVQPPDLEALSALNALLAASLLGRDTLRPFYIALSGIAKRYLERRLEAPVLEMTTTEMVAFLREHPLADPFADALRDLATAADQVKFAQGTGLRQEAERHLGAVREVVAALEARLRPRPEAQEKVA